MNRECRVCLLGLVDYTKARDLQERLAEARSAGAASDTLLLLEHPPTFTFGRSGKEEHLLVPRETLTRAGVSVHRTDRGGDVTFHGPGQLVGYPVLSLDGRPGGVGRYLRDLEETLIRGLAALGLCAGRSPGYTGVWVGDEKIAAIGVKVDSRKITRHGFALNVTTDLGYFRKIVPCGIRGKGVASVAGLLDRTVTLPEAAAFISAAFGEVFQMRMTKSEPHEILSIMEDEIGRARGF